MGSHAHTVRDIVAMTMIRMMQLSKVGGMAVYFGLFYPEVRGSTCTVARATCVL